MTETRNPVVPQNREGAQEPSRPVVARLTHVSKVFEGVAAVDDLSLDIYEGEFFSLLGPSGCGKTTTLRMLGGFEEPTQGTIYLGDEDVTYRPPYQRDINTVFQSYALFPHLSIFENVAFGLRRQKLAKDLITEKVRRMLEIVDLPQMEKRRPDQLSGGQQQRVALARALVNEPRLLLLDEPMSALDAKLRRQMQVELKRIQTTVGITFLYVTHDQEEAMSMSDRLAVMRGGKIQGMGSPREVYENPTSEFVATFLGASNLLPGVVGPVEGDRTSVRMVDGTVLWVPTARFAGIEGVREVKVGVRPEKIGLGSNTTSNGRNSVRGRVQVATFTGVGNQYVVQVAPDTEVTVYVQNLGDQSAPRTGEEVQLEWAVDHTFVVRPDASANAAVLDEGEM